MLNYIWAFMILIGVVFSAFTGNMQSVTEAALDSAKEAVSLCITMAGVMALWMGLMKIAEKEGLLAGMTRLISPLLSWLFPHIPREHPAKKYIATNMVANILGLGWAATPAGLMAMKELAKLEEERGSKNLHIASNEMCNFLILNISSLQLIPVNMIAYRSKYGSANPTMIIGPAIVATLLSTVAAVVFIKIMDRGGKRIGSSSR